MAEAPAHEETPPRRGAIVGWGACAAVAAVAALALAGVGGGPGGLVDRAIAVVFVNLQGHYPVLAVFFCSMGTGVLFRRVIGRGGPAEPLHLALGLALVLTVVHGVGVLGMLTPWVAVGMVVLGFAASAAWVVREAGRGRASEEAWRGEGWAWIVGVPIAVLVVASASPPGWLWDSEYGAYDALAYHLQLPQEWIRGGRVWPMDHNVYSYLPGYVESAYVFMAEMTFAPVDSAAGHGLTAGSGWRTQSTHVLGWFFAGLTAWSLGAFTAAMLARAGVGERAARRAGAWCAGALALATPWVVVVGSIAYNDLGVTALGGGAMLAAVDDRIRPAWRGVLAGGLVGVACGCKPTAMFFVAPVVGVLLVGTTARTKWAVVVGAAALAGALTLAPWMVRNWAASGNPVFPVLAGVLGEGHWTSEQAARYAAAHRFDGSVADRVRLLVWDNPSAPEGASAVARWRGAASPQWGLLFPAGVVAAMVAWARRGARTGVALLALGLAAQVLAWLFLTHLQSRFLVPCVLTLCPLVGIAVGSLRRVPVGSVGGGLIVLAQSAVLIAVFVGQRSGNPNAKLIEGLDYDLARRHGAWAEMERPWAWVNGRLDPGVRLYVVGDAAVFLYERGVVFNSTYDTWPLGEAIGAHPDDPAAWSGFLQDRGIGAVLVSLAEVDRLRRSGWADPRVTPARLKAWSDELGAPDMVWWEGRAALFMLDGEDDG